MTSVLRIDFRRCIVMSRLICCVTLTAGWGGGYVFNHQTGPLVQRFCDIGGVITLLVCGAFGGGKVAWHALHRQLVAARSPAVCTG